MENLQNSESPNRMLLVAAVREELGELQGEALGVGAIVAGVRMAQLIEQYQPTGVVMIGTAGAYEGTIEIGQACIARKVGYVSSAARMGLGYTPRPPPPVICDPSILVGVELPAMDVLTVAAITTDPLLATRLADGWQVEHLEAFGVALACQQAGIPFGLVLGISNEVGLDAHLQWLTHRNAAQDAARLVVEDWF